MPEVVTPDGLSINYVDSGDAAAPAVILLHGFTADLRMWMPVSEALARDYRVIAPDLRGHGRTGAPEDLDDYTMERYEGDVLALLDALEIDVAAVVGCSFGGMIAVCLAVHHPERVAGLVLSDTSAAFEHPEYDDRYREREARIAVQVEVVERWGTAELGKRAAADISDPFLAEGLRRRYAAMSREGYLGAARVRRERPDVLPLLAERLSMPVLVCTGSQDHVHSASLLMAGRIPGARVVTFRDTGHGIPALRPEAFTDVVTAFFADIEDAKAIAGRRTV
jgi:pimeloyl-ACP methyl ester carboxylesterase